MAILTTELVCKTGHKVKTSAGLQEMVIMWVPDEKSFILVNPDLILTDHQLEAGISNSIFGVTPSFIEAYLLANLLNQWDTDISNRRGDSRCFKRRDFERALQVVKTLGTAKWDENDQQYPGLQPILHTYRLFIPADVVGIYLEQVAKRRGQPDDWSKLNFDKQVDMILPKFDSADPTQAILISAKERGLDREAIRRILDRR